MSRALRLLTASTALAVAALAPAAAGSAATSWTTTSDRPAAPRAAGGITVGDTAVSSEAYVPVGRPAARATTWPVGGGRTDLTVHTTDAPTGVPAQQLSLAKLRFYRTHGGTMEAAVRLKAAPDASTKSYVLLAFGKVSSDRTQCLSPAGANIAFSSIKEGTASNPVYNGSSIQARLFQLPAAKTASWNCAFAKTASDVDFTNVFDSLGGDVELFRQKPILSVRISNRTISSRAFTTIPVVVSNSSDTVATAYGTRLSIYARGLSYRYEPAVGSITPGASRKGAIKLKYTSRYTSYFVLTFRSGDYVKKVKYTVTPVRR